MITRYRGYNIANSGEFSADDDVSPKSSICSRICCMICIILGIVITLFASLLLICFVLASAQKVPKYVDESTMNEIWQHPNMTSETFQQLPAILGRAITFPTVTNESGTYDKEIFKEFRDFLNKTFVNVFSSDIVHVDDRFPSFLLTVEGSGENASTHSFMLTAHMDVVPVNADSWTFHPFSGRWIQHDDPEESYVYGRGALDDKLSLVAILCALDELLGRGWTPNNTFYLGFGHDEEAMGNHGSAELAKLLEEKSVSELAFILDEGMPILDHVIMGMDVPVATIGVTEKGWIDVRLEATGVTGHSSIPPHPQATHALATAVHNLQSTPQPPMFDSAVTRDLFAAIAPKMLWPYRLVLGNMWLFKSLVSLVLSKERETDAMQRTTTATTIIRGGVKDNVVPGFAWANVNHRVHPRQTLQEVLDFDIAAINNPAINVTVTDSFEPAPVSPYGPDSPAFCLLAATVQRFYPDAIPAPSLLVGNTDTRHYLRFSKNVYRFMPYLLNKQDITGIHGNDERVSAANIWRAARFYHSLMLSADKGLARYTINSEQFIREL